METEVLGIIWDVGGTDQLKPQQCLIKLQELV